MEDLQTENTREVSIRDMILQYTRYWYLFVLGAMLAGGIAYTYLRYTTYLYRTQASIIIKEEKSVQGGGAIDLQSLGGLGGLLSKFKNNKILNEIAVFTSKRIIRKTVEELDLHIVYNMVGTLKSPELYEYKPFQVQYLGINDSVNLSKKRVPTLFFQIINDTQFKVHNANQSISGTYFFGKKIDLPFGSITVLPNMDTPSKFKNFFNKEVSVTYMDINRVVSQYQARFIVEHEETTSDLVSLSFQGPTPAKSEDFINEMVIQFNKDAIEDSGEVSKKTSEFIDSRLEIITRELDSVETGKAGFKTANRLVDIETQAQITLANADEFQKRQFGVNTQIELANSVIDFMENSSSNDLLPNNLGIEGENVSSAIENYNELVLQRNKLLLSSTSKNPVVVNITDQINEIRQNILSSLKNSTASLKMSLRDLKDQGSIVNSQLSKVPSNEKVYRSIERQQVIKEQLYLFLLQQREQASISLAVTSPKAKVVDPAYSSGGPIYPQNMVIYSGAIFAGLLIPFVLLYTKQLLNNKILNRSDVESLLPNINLIGEVPKLKRGEEDIIKLNDRSVLAESFRILRTNLQYLFVNKTSDSEGKAKRVFITSTIKGEGKTMIAFNLALSLSSMNKKVVLIGADIRNPQLQRYLPKESKSLQGLTEFIVYDTLKAKDLVLKSDYLGLDILLSGAIPPNPAELLIQDRTGEVFEQLEEEYDYIIVDTAPSMLVTDTILINKYADVMLYVTRAGYTDKRLLEFTQDVVSSKRLTNVNMVLNNVSMNNFGYGNKYGYAYSEDKPSLWKRMFQK
ncbi:putative EPS related membrane protein [unidentified eubacterium SCB49]|nr:putative EPS related membrane protein [unidentified eubacterium SCB49]